MRPPISVVELAPYQRLASELLNSDEQNAVIDLVAYNPVAGDLIPGTGGVRKLRVGLDGIGKRGGARVIYYFYNETVPLFLIPLYAKSQKADLSKNEKREFSHIVQEIVRVWAKR